MKKLLMKTVIIAILCSVGIPNFMQAGLGNKQIGALVCCAIGGLVTYKFVESCGLLNNGNKSDLYDFVYRQCKYFEPVTEENSRRIFESKEAQECILKRFLKVNIEFMETFTGHCKSSKNDGMTAVKKNTALKAYYMAENYLNYLKKPYLSKRDLLFFGLGVGGTALALGGIKNNNIPLMLGTAAVTAGVTAGFVQSKQLKQKAQDVRTGLVSGFKKTAGLLVRGFKKIANRFRKN